MKSEQNKILISLKSTVLGIFLIFKTAFIILVIPVLIIAIIAFVSILIGTKDYKNINATIIETKTLNTDDNFKYETKLEYIVDNITYHQTIYEDHPYKTGEQITIKYNPENPKEFSEGENFSVIFILICFTILFGSILFLLINGIKLFYRGLKQILQKKEIGHKYIKEIRKEENKWKKQF